MQVQTNQMTFLVIKILNLKLILALVTLCSLSLMVQALLTEGFIVMPASDEEKGGNMQNYLQENIKLKE